MIEEHRGKNRDFISGDGEYQRLNEMKQDRVDNEHPTSDQVTRQYAC